MKISKLKRNVNDAFRELLVPPTTYAELINYIEYRFNNLIVK